MSGKKPKRCIFCGAGGPGETNLVLYQSRKTLVMMNRFPYNSGHVMVAPLRHVNALEKLTRAEADELFAVLQQTIRVLKAELRPEGLNVGLNLGKVAGAGVAGHLHIHVVPRWLGDTNFMPVAGQTKVISQALTDTWHRLSRRFQTRPGKRR